MMIVRRTMHVGLVLSGLLLLVSACTFASPTHVALERASEEEVKDGQPASASVSPAGVTCTGTFVKPDVSTLTPCGDGRGHCYDKTKVPAPDGFIACPTADQVCVPDEVLAAAGSPLKSCTSIVGPGGCSTMSLLNLPPELKSQVGMLKQDVCSTGQLCAPCINPMDNSKTGACEPVGVFDKPCTGAAAAGRGGGTAGAPATPQEACCTTNGKSNGICIAETAIPEAQRGDTVSDTCKGGAKCVPAAFVSGAPVTCKGGPFDDPGVCMDKCFSGMMALAGPLLANDACGATEICVPCFLGKSKGLPGCE
jgi:hypothetical protein